VEVLHLALLQVDHVAEALLTDAGALCPAAVDPLAAADPCAVVDRTEKEAETGLAVAVAAVELG